MHSLSALCGGIAAGKFEIHSWAQMLCVLSELGILLLAQPPPQSAVICVAWPSYFFRDAAPRQSHSPRTARMREKSRHLGVMRVQTQKRFRRSWRACRRQDPLPHHVGPGTADPRIAPTSI